MPLLKAILWPILKTVGTNLLINLMHEGIKELEKRPNSSATQEDVKVVEGIKKLVKEWPILHSARSNASSPSTCLV